MNVERNNFFEILPTILKRISNAHFIAFDLELSGIPERGQNRDKGRASRQERYAELKAAAEKYQILQVGLTIVEEDRANNRYLIRPFNFNLSPLVEDETYVGVERDFTYSSSAVNFLRREGYDMSSPFSSGVPYLTRQETDLAWQRVRRRFDRNMIPDIIPAASDIQALSFIARVQREVSKWQEGAKIAGSIEITGFDTDNNPRMLNRFEKRLVHQTVRSDFPALESFSTLNSVKVKKKEVNAADVDQEPWRKQVGTAICLQTGFRFVAEAIAAGSLDDLDPTLCSRYIAGESQAPNRATSRRRLKELTQACIESPKVLVGHNCFIDVIYLFKLFYGDLPDTVEDFQAAVHDTFPNIFDTKYMATAGSFGNRFRGSNLQELDNTFAHREEPDIYKIGDHPHYAEEDSSFHEAGFDSFATAKVFLRLAACFQALSTGADAASLLKKEDATSLSSHLRHPTASNSLGTPGGLENVSGTDGTTESNDIQARLDVSQPTSVGTSQESANHYETLSDSDLETVSDMVERSASRSSTVEPEVVEALPVDIEKLRVDRGQVSVGNSATAKATPCMLQSWDAAFWHPYKNKLRLFGTIEEEAILQPNTTAPPTEREGKVEDSEEQPSLFGKVRSFFT